jgi:hypothetical protein
MVMDAMIEELNCRAGGRNEKPYIAKVGLKKARPFLTLPF